MIIKRALILFISVLLIMAFMAPATEAFETHDPLQQTPDDLRGLAAALVNSHLPDDVDANLRTHPWLTWMAIGRFQNSVRRYGITLSPEAKREIIYGSIEEDYGVLGTSIIPCYSSWDLSMENTITKLHSVRAVNHFYAGSKNNDVSPDFGRLTDVQTFLFCPGVPWYSARTWGTIATENTYNWARVIRPGDEMERWRALGHVLHLMEDMGSPAHVRNDGHAFRKDEYETALADRLFYSQGHYLPGDNALTPKSQITDYFDDLADITQRNFFSGDTIYKANQGIMILANPAISWEAVNDPDNGGIWIYIVNRNEFNGAKLATLGLHDVEIAKASGAVRASDVTNYYYNPVKGYHIINDACVNDFWSRMAPVLIENAAGIVEMAYKEIIGPFPDIETPSTPTNLVPTTVSSTQINLSWTASTDNVDVAKYKIWRQKFPDEAPVPEFISEVDGNIHSYEDVNLQPSTNYCYQVSALDAAGNESGKSEPASCTRTDDLVTNSIPFSDNFNDNFIDTNQWVYGGYNVTEAAGIMKVETSATDNGGWSTTKRIQIDSMKPVIITRKAKLNYVNDYFTATMSFHINSAKTGIWDDGSFGIAYGNHNYHDSTWCTLPNGFYIYRKGLPIRCSGQVDGLSQKITPLWGQWFNEKIIYNPSTGLFEYFINEIKQTELNVGALPAGSSISLGFDAWGWWTGHYQYFDDINISQDQEAPGGIPLPPTNLTPLEVSGTQINLSWTAASGSVSIAKYRIYRENTADGTETAIDISPELLSYEDLNLAPSTKYCYQVSALDAAGHESEKTTSVCVQTSAVQETHFTPTGSMTTKRADHRATLLPNGKVLITGGQDGTVGGLNTAELYDPDAGTFTPSGNMNTKRYDHTATLLPNGKVLIAGGYTGNVMLNSAEIYDPETGTFSPTAGTMANVREAHTATLLNDGTVLIAGGWTGYYAHTASEIYNPTTGQFSPTGSMSYRRYVHTATLLSDGRVLISAGSTGGVSNVGYKAEIYDPVTKSYSVTGDLKNNRCCHQAVLLPNGKVLVASGWEDRVPQRMVELYDLFSGEFNLTSGSVTAGYTTTLLSDGKVLLAGGTTETSTPLLYDYNYDTFSTIGNLTAQRGGHTATKLQNGNVLIVGGRSASTILETSELYIP